MADQRLQSLDAFRGMTIASMLLVNNPGTWSAIYWPLEHAEWHGWTPTDLIFPFFLFIVGVTTHLSRKEPRQILRRGGLIILFGLLLNAFPFFWWGKIPDVPHPSFLERVIWRFDHLRFLGVLQRIGIVYIVSALIALRTTRRQKIAVILAILIGYWMVMTLIPVPDSGTVGRAALDHPADTLAAWSDRLILGTKHIWASSKTWDPEGPLSTIPAIATALFGVLAGEWITDASRSLSQRVRGLLLAGGAGFIAGQLWHLLFPINKNLWTSSYVVFTAGFACVLLSLCLWVIDLRGVNGWSRPFVIYGMNPLVAFVGSGLMARLTDSLIKIDGTSLHTLSYELAFEPYFPAKLASLLWGLCFVLFWFGILAILYRRRIFVRV